MEKLLKELYSRFGKDVTLQTLREGKDKMVYLAVCSQGSFVVLLNKRTYLSRKYRALKSNDLQKHLFDNGLNVAQVLDVFELDNGQIVACHAYLEGKQIQELDKKTAWQVGCLIGKMHQISFKEKMFGKCFPKKYMIYGLLKQLTDRIRYAKSFVFDKNWRRLPCGICHRDLNLTNFIFEESKVYLIDFDRFRYMPFAYELQRLLKDVENNKVISSVVQGYSSVKELTETEKRYLIDCFGENIFSYS